MAVFGEWLTAQELSGMPGMPKTYSAVIRWAKKFLPQTRSKLRGKGIEYSRESLPEETKDYLKALDLAAILQNQPAVPQAVSAPVLSDQALVVAGTRQVQLMDGAPTEPETDAHQRERELARLVVIRTLHEIRHTQGTTTQGAARILLENARAGRLAPVVMTKLRRACDERGCRAAAAEDDLPSVMTLRRWAARHKAGKSLVPLRSTVPDLTVRPWYRPFFALTDRPQKPTLKWALEQLVANWRPEWADVPGGGPPTYDAARRAYEKRSRLDILKGRHTGSALRAKTFYHKRTYAGLPPFTEVHSDGWTTHFTAPHPVTGQFVTYEVWHFHDVATRYVTPMAVGLTENTDVVLRGLESCIRVGGLIAIWQTDHTSSVKNARVMEEHSGLADRLGLTVVHPQEVGNSQANGIAENFNTWLDRESRELATYQHPQRMDSGTFVRVRRITNAMVKASDKPAERAKLRAQAMRLGKGLVFDTHAEAVAWIASKEKKWNNHPHRELPRVRNAAGKLVHMTPQQSLDAAIAAGWEPMSIPEEQLVDQFRPHVRKKVTRGTVTPYGGMRYHHEALAHHEGEEVLVAINKDNPAQVRVKTLQGEPIAWCKFVAAVGPRTESMAEHTEHMRAMARKRLRENQIAEIDAAIAPPVLDLPSPPMFDLKTLPSAWRMAEELADRVPQQMSFLETMQHIEEMEAKKRERDAAEAAALQAAAEVEANAAATAEIDAAAAAKEATG